MIKNFKSKETQKVFRGEYSKKIPREIQNKTYRMLKVLNNISDPLELRFPPSNRFEALKGKRKGEFSVSVNMQWRICFKFQNGDAYNVEIIDYH